MCKKEVLRSGGTDIVADQVLSDSTCVVLIKKR